MHARPVEPHAIAVGGDTHVEPEQQPVAQLAALQLEQTPPPHVLPPVHVEHAKPPVPQALALVPGWQLVPWQQPAHDVESHAHAPAMQRCPVPQAAPAPQLQPPLAEQPSPTPVIVQLVHAPPAVPQVVADRGLHVAPEQHPLAHALALHTHAPATHACPAAHAAPTPHAHVPFVQRSERASQAAHEPPDVPHAVTDATMQLEPEQHPVAQFAAVQLAHVPALQAPVAQAEHAVPPVPHAEADVPGMQLVPAQHPAHDVPSQTHAPAAQCCPLAHAGPLPHRHAPPVHESVTCGSHTMHAAPAGPHALVAAARHVLPLQQPVHEVASHTQKPPAQCCPATQLGPVPHAHPPDAHPSASAGSHAMHVFPPPPHVEVAGALHVPLWQQPLAHEVASHTHAPPTQC